MSPTTTCLLCGQPMTLRWRVRDHLRPEAREDYAVAWCSACRCGRVAAALTPEQVAGLYAAGYYTHHVPAAPGKPAGSLRDRLRLHLAWRADRGMDFTPDELPPVAAGASFCDVGCGSGEALKRMRRAGYTVAGIEPDQAARSLASRNGTVYAGTAEALPEALAGCQFNVILLSHVLEHCIDPLAALRNVKLLLAPGGTAVVEVPNNAARALEQYGPGWFFADIPRHLHFFTESSLHRAFEQAGLRVQRTLYTGYTRQFALEWLAAQSEIGRRLGCPESSFRDAAAWGLLMRTAFAPPAAKYDSIRVHATYA